MWEVLCYFILWMKKLNLREAKSPVQRCTAQLHDVVRTGTQSPCSGAMAVNTLAGLQNVMKTHRSHSSSPVPWTRGASFSYPGEQHFSDLFCFQQGTETSWGILQPPSPLPFSTLLPLTHHPHIHYRHIRSRGMEATVYNNTKKAHHCQLPRT